MLLKKKTKSKTPIVFKLPKEQQDKLKLPPRLSLAAWCANQQTATDWYNLTFRLKVGYELARQSYAQETIDGMVDIMDACLRIRQHHIDFQVWYANEADLDLLALGVETVDIMQDETTRREQLTAHRIAHAYVHGLINY